MKLVPLHFNSLAKEKSDINPTQKFSLTSVVFFFVFRLLTARTAADFSDYANSLQGFPGYVSLRTSHLLKKVGGAILETSGIAEEREREKNK